MDSRQGISEDEDGSVTTHEIKKKPGKYWDEYVETLSESEIQALQF
jgi:hypothetical protein